MRASPTFRHDVDDGYAQQVPVDVFGGNSGLYTGAAPGLTSRLPPVFDRVAGGDGSAGLRRSPLARDFGDPGAKPSSSKPARSSRQARGLADETGRVPLDFSRRGNGGGDFHATGLSHDRGRATFKNPARDRDSSSATSELSVSFAPRRDAVDVVYDDEEDMNDITDGAVRTETALAILDCAVTKGGFPVGHDDFRRARGKLVAWLIRNSASGRQSFDKVLHIGDDAIPLPTQLFKEAMSEYNVNELRRVWVPLLPTARKLLDKAPRLRQAVGALGGIESPQYAWCALDSAEKYPNISAREMAIAKRAKANRLNKLKGVKNDDQLDSIFSDISV